MPYTSLPGLFDNQDPRAPMIVAVANAVKEYIEKTPLGQFPGDFVVDNDAAESPLQALIRKAVLQSMPEGEDGESDSDSGDILEEDDDVDPSGNKFLDNEAEEEEDDDDDSDEEAPAPKKRKSEATNMMQTAYEILKGPAHKATLVGNAEAKLRLVAEDLEKMSHESQSSRGMEWILQGVRIEHGARIVLNGLPEAFWNKYTESDVDGAVREWREHIAIWRRV